MDELTLLTALKVDLGISGTGYNERLTQYLQSAKTRIERRGITLDVASSLDDAQLVVSFAAWQWRHRATGAAMPEMLRGDLHDRVIAEKAGGSDG